ncbi:hypothetical protein [Arthrobacter pigmenti]
MNLVGFEVVEDRHQGHALIPWILAVGVVVAMAVHGMMMRAAPAVGVVVAILESIM